MNFLKNGYQAVQQGVTDTLAQVKEALEPWKDVNQIMIVQRPDFLECFCPCICEGKNVYDLVALDDNGNMKQQIGTISENSECCSRFICQCWRPFKLHIQSSDAVFNQEVNGEKPWSICTTTPMMCPFMWCCNGFPCSRPEIMITKDNNYIGKIVNPHRCFGRSGVKCCPWEELNILDSNGNMKYFVSASCCQTGQWCRVMGLCCRCCIGKELRFNIMNAQKEQVGEIVNVYNGCFQETCTKEDKFIIRFPRDANFQEKVLILHAAIMVDFDIFEDTCYHLA